MLRCMLNFPHYHFFNALKFLVDFVVEKKLYKP